ncbi:HD domain-containing protein [Kaistia dalseonensis]|uniref:HD domain-containing protein n=1 Tax=Kaistia dalseonensis TaxID=410840 RepID=A0ABU0HCL3_9HYPH|nr:HD domain-containing protein [Kaistia dalseonensis]MCX5497419.1 HD domain-containing protein [Kaistia dalseonensis]MDQ0440058.1 hypothetical protein [Kaistia dalseonensis]
MLTGVALLDELLGGYSEALAGDFVAYRNHAYRVLNLCVAAAGADDDAEAIEKIAIAAALHDMGIWTAHTFDYLAPSVTLATTFLETTGRSAWVPEISAMILEHHKITPYRRRPDWLVEPFRRADWADVTWGVTATGDRRRFIREFYALWPDAGFHALLVRLEIRHLARYPLNPLPVIRL